MLRNSQNTLHSSSTSIRKSTDTKTESTPSITSKIQSNQLKNQIITVPDIPKGTYTSSIYINSIENSCNAPTNPVSPVLSMHRVNGIEEDNKISIRIKGEENQVYITTAAIHRHSDITNQRSESLRTNLNFVSI